jgi:hypothetical protein
MQSFTNIGEYKKGPSEKSKKVLNDNFHIRKEKVRMNKWLIKLSGTALAAMLITGCAANNQDVPPPENEQPPAEEPMDPDMEQDENKMEEDMQQDEENMEEDTGDDQQ